MRDLRDILCPRHFVPLRYVLIQLSARLTRVIINTYWARSSLMLKISMLPNSIVDDGEAGVHYRVWKHTKFQHWTRPSLNKCFSITYKRQKERKGK